VAMPPTSNGVRASAQHSRFHLHPPQTKTFGCASGSTHNDSRSFGRYC